MAQKIVDHTTSIEDLDKQEAAEEKANQQASAAVDQTTEETTEASQQPKQGKRKKIRSPQYKKARESIDKDKTYTIEEAIKELRKASYVGFNESVELHIELGTDKTKTDQRIRFTTSLPHGTGKKSKILVIGNDNSGEKDGVIWRDSSAIDEIQEGKLKPDADFNDIIATPNMMKDIAKVAKILGPKGLMPSPKTGTVTDTPETAIEELQKGQIEVRSQPGHTVIHQVVGNLGFKDEELVENINHLLDELRKNAPAKVKKKFIQGIYICSTMSPSLKVEA